MAGRLEGRAAIVTGAGSIGPGWGNGKAAAALFAREGAEVRPEAELAGEVVRLGARADEDLAGADAFGPDVALGVRAEVREGGVGGHLDVGAELALGL